MRALRPSSHKSCRKPWHLGQCRLRQLLYDGCRSPHAVHTSRWPPSSAVRQRHDIAHDARLLAAEHVAAAGTPRHERGKMSAISQRGRTGAAVVRGEHDVSWDTSRG